MSRRLILLLLIALPAYADFRDVERTLRAQLGAPMYIPLLGVARFATWMVHPHGVHDFQLATWEKTADPTMDGGDLERLLRRGLSPDFQALVRVRSRREWTFIYARPIGNRFEIMLLTHDQTDTVLVRADVDAEQLSRTVRDRRMAKF